VAGRNRRAPKTKQKLSAEAQAELGVLRQCSECWEEKPVNRQTFALSKRKDSLRGWSNVCRVCQGVTAAEKGVTRAPSKIREAADNARDIIAEMYACHPERDRARLEEIKKELDDRLVALDHDEAAQFELFIDILSPLVAGWMEPGAIHDDIKKGLLSKHLRVLIIATRYSAKSTLTAMYVAWKIWRNPLTKILVISRGENLAKRMLRIVRRVFIENCPLLEHLKPNEDCLDAADQFQTPQAANVATGGVTLMSLGVTSNLPGYRSDETICDDVEGPKDDTPEKIVDLEETLNEIHMINPKGRKVMLGTYQSEFSVYAKLADLDDDEGTKVWEEHRACMFEEDEVDGKKIIHSRWPAMFTDKQALDWRRAVTERAWRLHALLIADPTILNERPLKIKDLIVVNRSPKDQTFPVTVEGGGEKLNITTWAAPKGDAWYGPRAMADASARYAMTIVAVDPASGLAGRDAIGVAVLGVTPSGYGVIRHVEGVRAANKAQAMRRTAEIVREFSATVLVVEELADGFFGETLEGQLVLLGYPMAVEKVTAGQQKKGQRIIESLAPPMAAGRLCILESVARSDHGGEFVNQMVRVSYDGRTGAKTKDHDDYVDALAHAVARAKGSLISDIADNIANYETDKLENYRGRSLREGGLGTTGGITMGVGRHDVSGMQDMPLAERLLEEDQVLISLTERRDRLQATVQTDLAVGREPDARMVITIRNLTNQIKELKEVQVL